MMTPPIRMLLMNRAISSGSPTPNPIRKSCEKETEAISAKRLTSVFAAGLGRDHPQVGELLQLPAEAGPLGPDQLQAAAGFRKTDLIVMSVDIRFPQFFDFFQRLGKLHFRGIEFIRRFAVTGGCGGNFRLRLRQACRQIGFETQELLMAQPEGMFRFRTHLLPCFGRKRLVRFLRMCFQGIFSVSGRAGRFARGLRDLTADPMQVVCYKNFFAHSEVIPFSLIPNITFSPGNSRKKRKTLSKKFAISGRDGTLPDEKNQDAE